VLDVMKDRQEFGTRMTVMTRRRHVARILILIVDAGLVVWGAMAAALPDYLLGPGGKPILPAGFEGFTGSSWSELVSTSPMMAIAITVTAFRRGDGWAWWALLVGNTIALVSAMTYDRIVNAIGPFELTEYLGLAMIYGALAVTAPLHGAGRRVRSTA
jgi:hypothetical protein